MKTNTSQRLLALDIFRGITIAGMIMVNNPGSWRYVYAPLRHAQWNGLTPTDLVFPFFMFIMGVSTYLSLRKYDFEFNYLVGLKIIRRSAVIFIIGLGIAWFSLFCRTFHSLGSEDISFGARVGESAYNFGHLRLLGVLQRLAISYGVVALIALWVKHKYIPYIIVAALGGYLFLLIVGDGFVYGSANILSSVDRAVLGDHHMYKDHGIDPEGLLSTIPSIAHVLIGFCCGRLLVEVKDIGEKLQYLFLIGTVFTFFGFLFSYGCPINKKVWSPTFVLVTCGLGSSFLALLIWIIDMKRYKKWCCFFEIFGVNPLFMYVLGAIFAIFLSNVMIEHRGETISLHGYFYNMILRPSLDDYPSSLAYALFLVGLNWIFGYILYKKKLYIKI